jgi:hypothetical protein
MDEREKPCWAWHTQMKDGKNSLLHDTVLLISHFILVFIFFIFSSCVRDVARDVGESETHKMTKNGSA